MGCEQQVPLWDEMEQCFASPEIQQRVLDMQEESAIELSNQSKERALVGEVTSTVALTDQISREFNVSDQGIGMEIEFNDEAHEATNRKLCLQLESGDSYTHNRKSDGAEIFTIKKQRHAEYLMAQAFPVLLVIRNSEGEVRWMEVRDSLKRERDDGKKPAIDLPLLHSNSINALASIGLGIGQNHHIPVAYDGGHDRPSGFGQRLFELQEITPPRNRQHGNAESAAVEDRIQ